MVVKSKGSRKRTREKFRGPAKFTVNRFVRQFKVGDNVALVVYSASHSGQPFRRFHGRSGKVIGTRGRSYIVEIKDGTKLKKVISKPEHLKAV